MLNQLMMMLITDGARSLEKESYTIIKSYLIDRRGNSSKVVRIQ